MSEEEHESVSNETNFNESDYISKIYDELENENADETLEDNQEQEKNQDDKKTEKSNKFPLARIRNIMKMDPELNLASQESVFLITRATELFLAQLAQSAYHFTAKSKRKTVQKRDVDAAIESIDSLCFLEGALE